MTPLFPLSTLELLAKEQPLEDVEYGEYCRASASVIVANRAGMYAWIGLDINELPVEVIPAPRQAIMIAEQLAKRAYQNPDAIVAEGGIGPIGGDRTVEDFARTFELTPAEAEYLDNIAESNGTSANTNRIGTLSFSVRPTNYVGGTIWIPDLDARAEAWPIGSEDYDGYAYGSPA